MTAAEARTRSENPQPAPRPGVAIMPWVYLEIEEAARRGSRERSFNKYTLSAGDFERSGIIQELKEKGYRVELFDRLVIVRW